jgi:hypothetical protein
MRLQLAFPELFWLARRKNLSIKEAMQNGRWMKGLQRMDSPAQIDQFAELWTLVHSTHLSDNEDVISWTKSSDSTYSASTAYLTSFSGSTPKPLLAAIWDTKIEGKVKFFLWLILQNRLWTGQRLQDRGWPHNDKCALCNLILEDANHLVLACPYALEVWQGFVTTHNTVTSIAQRSTTIAGWWKKIARFRKNKTKKELTTIAVYTIWHLWKERNRRIFEDCSCSPTGLLAQIRADVQNVTLAFRS